MGKTLALILVVLMAMVCLGACSSRSRRLTDDTLANAPLPFDNYGFFIITLPIVGEYDEINSFGNFSFGGVERWRTVGTATYTKHYIAINFHLHATDFISLMNSLTPILVDAVTVCTLSTTNWLQNPFRGFAREEHLYFWGRNDFYVQMIGVRMTVYQIGAYGYLFFSLSNWERSEPYGRVRSDDSIHHSLYRISPSDLDRISEFAEGLERGAEIWHGHSTFTRSFIKGVIIAGVLGFLVFIWSCIVIFRRWVSA